MITTIVIAYVLFSILSGAIEAWLWIYGINMNINHKKLIHVLLFIQRFCVGIISWILINDILATIGLWLTFFFIHDGSYYQVRGWIEKSIGKPVTYEKGFFD